ncbi:MAG: Gfo/Idh/MocA family oxidoreductase [Clostridia bacterium]|nr:Gfo/Idh/MocA family oxidoreductase [Clostridia bacterium]
MAYRIGIIGTNFVSDWLCEAVAETGLFVSAAVYSRTEEKGRAFADKHGIPQVFTDLEAFLSSDLDIVYVASPNSLHCQHAVAAMQHGKHVLCEKPIATTAAELELMKKTAAEHQRVLLEAMRPAFDPAIQLVKDSLPALGQIRRVCLEYCQYSSRYDKFKNGEIMNAFNPALGNAAIMDIGVYAVHVCLQLFGKPTGEIISKSVILQNGMEGMGTIFLPYSDFQAEVVYAKIIDSVNGSCIIGENGTILIDKISVPGSIKLQLRGKELVELLTSTVSNNMIYELNALADLIARGDIEHRYMEVSTMEMEILDTVRKQNNIKFK